MREGVLLDAASIPLEANGQTGTVKLTDVVPNQRLGHSLSC